MKDLSRLIICIIAIAIAGIFTIAAQDTQQYDFSAVRINGLEIGKFYTREQYLEALGGQPHRESDDAYHFLIYQTTMALAPAADPELSDIKKAETKYDLFGYSAWQGYEGFYFASFFIHSDKYAINDYVRVGDPVSKVRDMGGTVRDVNYDGYKYLYWAPEGSPDDPQIEWGCYPRFGYDDNGIITEIELYYD